ncbi:permease [Klebsiella pneumoniae]|uniref:Permease n=1 Tax=Klebsiella pneumoniae TaxID=573 RepID=A0A377WDQ8_KLEPN|nr:permease [Klebsiella pneumoniae]
MSADPDDTEQMDMRTLWKTHTDRARAELHWRFTLVATVFIMALMVVPLSVVNPRQGRVLSMLPAMLLYLVFFLLQTSIKSNGGKGKMDPAIWMWAINLLYFALAVLLNLWDTVPMRRFRARFNKGAGLMQAFGVLDRYIGKTIFNTIMMTCSCWCRSPALSSLSIS